MYASIKDAAVLLDYHILKLTEDGLDKYIMGWNFYNELSTNLGLFTLFFSGNHALFVFEKVP